MATQNDLPDIAQPAMFKKLSPMTDILSAKPRAYIGGKPSPRIGANGVRMKPTGLGSGPVPTTPALPISSDATQLLQKTKASMRKYK